jgi:hypothetical protein
MTDPVAAFGKDTPLGKLLNDIYNPRKRNEPVFHGVRPSGARSGSAGAGDKPAWGMRDPGESAAAGQRRRAAAGSSVPRVGSGRVGTVSVDRIGADPGARRRNRLGVRPSIKTQGQILAEDPYAVEQFRPMPAPAPGGVDRNGRRVLRGGEAEKTRFQDKVAGIEGGGDASGTAGGARARNGRNAGANDTEVSALPVEDQLTIDLIAEIDERKAFLQEMEGLGQGAEYEAQIKAEIAERVRRLKQIERERA